MTTSAIPFTATAPGWTSTCPRPLGHIRPHPDIDSTETPALPTPPRPPVFHTTIQGVYRLSTHLVPAAYPRLTPDIPLPEIPAHVPGESRSARRDKTDVLVRHALETQDAYMEGRLLGESSQRLLWNCVNRYVRTSRRAVTAAGRDITLFLAHANGFHKEVWEPMLRGLLDAPGGEMISEVWAWEAVQHGDAAIVNAKNQNGIFDWLDNTRDIINFLLHYLPEDVESTVMPTRLARLPPSVTKTRVRDGYRARQLVTVGHSIGGCTSSRAAIDFPKLFSSIILVDPVIHRPMTYPPGYIEQLVLGAFTRCDRWPSRAEALKSFKGSRFFCTWHPAALQLYLDHALIDDPEGGVRLKMSGLQEGLGFTSRMPSCETWELLERLDKGISLRWVVPDKPLSTRELTNERVWRRPANASNVVFHFAGHLIVQEAPLELARDISGFLLQKYESSLRSHL